MQALPPDVDLGSIRLEHHPAVRWLDQLYFNAWSDFFVLVDKDGTNARLTISMSPGGDVITPFTCTPESAE